MIDTRGHSLLSNGVHHPPQSVYPVGPISLHRLYYLLLSVGFYQVEHTFRPHHLLLHASPDATSQWLLKYILFTVPLLHAKYQDDNPPTPRDGTDPVTRLRGKGTPQDELSANHVLAERRRREKLNERFIILRSLVPFVTKMDEASILGDTIEYVKQLRKKIQDLESRNRQMEAEQQSRERQRSLTRVGSEKKKMRIVEGSAGMRKPKSVEASPPGVVTSVQVSIIESDGLLGGLQIDAIFIILR